jgi:hypothetical protein
MALEPVWTLWSPPPHPNLKKNPSLPGTEPWFPNSPEPIANSIHYHSFTSNAKIWKLTFQWYNESDSIMNMSEGRTFQLLTSLWERLKKKITSSPAVFYWAMKSYHRSIEKQGHQIVHRKWHKGLSTLDVLQFASSVHCLLHHLTNVQCNLI